MKPAAITAGIITLIWLIFRNQPDTCCPHCDWEVEDDATGLNNGGHLVSHHRPYTTEEVDAILTEAMWNEDDE